jgi:hypothetical protein
VAVPTESELVSGNLEHIRLDISYKEKDEARQQVSRTQAGVETASRTGTSIRTEIISDSESSGVDIEKWSPRPVYKKETV